MALLLVVGTYNVAFLSCELTRTTRPVTEIESCRVGASRAGAGQTLVVWWNPCRAGQTLGVRVLRGSRETPLPRVGLGVWMLCGRQLPRGPLLDPQRPWGVYARSGPGAAGQFRRPERIMSMLQITRPAVFFTFKIFDLF